MLNHCRNTLVYVAKDEQTHCLHVIVMVEDFMVPTPRYPLTHVTHAADIETHRGDIIALGYRV